MRGATRCSSARWVASRGPAAPLAGASHTLGLGGVQELSVREPPEKGEEPREDEEPLSCEGLRYSECDPPCRWVGWTRFTGYCAPPGEADQAEEVIAEEGEGAEEVGVAAESSAEAEAEVGESKSGAGEGGVSEGDEGLPSSM